jgi:hypothetical protein
MLGEVFALGFEGVEVSDGATRIVIWALVADALHDP